MAIKMIDIVFPNGNENDFIKMASRLGYTAICFAYTGEKIKAPGNTAEYNALGKQLNVEIFFAAIAGKSGNYPFSENISLNIAIAEPFQDLRPYFEVKRTDIMLGLEQNQPRDSSHSRNSGLNQVLASLSKSNEISIGFSFAQILDSKGMLKSQILGRIRQNIRLARKFRLDTTMASFAANPLGMRNPHDMASLFAVLGMTHAEAAKSLEHAHRQALANAEQKRPGYLGKGMKHGP